MSCDVKAGTCCMCLLTTSLDDKILGNENGEHCNDSSHNAGDLPSLSLAPGCRAQSGSQTYAPCDKADFVRSAVTDADPHRAAEETATIAPINAPIRFM